MTIMTIWFSVSASNMVNLDDLDELEVYGSEVNQSGSQVTQYTFEVRQYKVFA